ncbi:MAG: hypothetical protein U5J96_13790 [Ignavibacteriaceae bacterium]|nr:hypothetical protein [Ignavibacteriaceae bacterium]
MSKFSLYPSINLPPKPLEKDETQILGGVGYFPETRTDRVTSKMAFGGEIQSDTGSVILIYAD